MTQKEFYKTKAWQQCRAAYIRSVGGLCEDCLRKGLYTPAVIVHHRKHLDDSNVNDPAVAMGFDNLKAVCRECHGVEHRVEMFGGRYSIDAAGNVVTI